MSQGYFITGTDTGIGKTTVACALIHYLRRKPMRVIGMKPVAAGTEPTASGPINEDVERLRAASNVQVPPQLDNPYLLHAPISPHLAAAEQGEHIDLQKIVCCYRALTQQADTVVVEGAGGFCVPLTASQTGADLAMALQLPIVLVVGMRLGCLNHALLTQEAILARGLTLAGWVANEMDPSMRAAQGNMATLQARLHAPLWARMPWHAGAALPAIDFDIAVNPG